MSETYYQLLGVPTDADDREVRRAYHRLARELHPDKAESPEQAKFFEEKFARISTAYNTLKDTNLREKYDDKTLNKSNAASPASARTATAAVLTAEKKASAAATGAPSTASRSAVGARQDRRNDKGLTPERIGIAQKAFAKGLQLARAGDYAKAVEFFDAAITNNDSEATYYANLGLALIEAKKSASKAIDSVRKAIELDAYNQNFRFNLAYIYETIGSKSNAKRVYEEILRWEPENQMAQQLLRKLNQKDSGFFSKLAASSSILSNIRNKLNRN
jgi:curved DNA-binding protein CbpA